MADSKRRPIVERITGARNMQTRYEGLAEVASGSERTRFEMLADYWRDAAERLEKERDQTKEPD